VMQLPAADNVVGVLTRLLLIPLVLVALVGAIAAAPARAAVPAPAAVAGRDYDATRVIVRSVSGGERIVRVRPGHTVAGTIAALETRPGVASATPDWFARASFLPNDPGRGRTAGGWSRVQWNLSSPVAGINAPAAWDRLITAGRPGGAGVVVAVLDTGIAYRDFEGYRRSPDLNPRRFRRGYDFVANDPYPLDENGHGTHVASTIAEAANNGIGLAGIAYGATIMPVRVLNSGGVGLTTRIAAGIRFAAANGADIINLSFEFGPVVLREDIPNVLDALRYARRKGVLVVGASGNAGASVVAYPARSADVLAVGATTENGCRADYSNEGMGLDVVAPGGGPDAELDGDPNCRPSEPQGADIFQMTYTGASRRRFGLPGGYIGTSMAAPHVSATAALVIASGVLGPDPTPGAVKRRLKLTARDLGAPGPDEHYGAGLLDAARATDPAVPVT
jgi:serine protease